MGTHLHDGPSEKRRSPVTYASRSTNFVGRANAAAISKPLHVFRTRKTTMRSTSCESPSCEAYNVAETRSEVIGREAFQEMFVAARSKFVAMASAILRNREDAEDAVQNAFLSGYLHLRSFEGRSALRTWFTRIVMNAALMIQRKRKPSRYVPLVDSAPDAEIIFWEQISALGPDPEKGYGDKEALQQIDAQLAKMPPALRQAFAMTYYDELSHREACQMLDIPIGTFKARLFRARRLVVSRVSPPKKKLIASLPAQNDGRPGTLRFETAAPLESALS